MLKQAVSLADLSPGDRVVDLFCGAGNFTLAFAAAGAEVSGFEGDAALCEQGRANAKRLGYEHLCFTEVDLFDAAACSKIDMEQTDLVVLDPPRAGAEAVVPSLLDAKPAKILYVSCHPATMLRDIQALSSGYRVEQVGVMDMFPQTTHLESMALLVRR